MCQLRQHHTFYKPAEYTLHRLSLSSLSIGLIRGYKTIPTCCISPSKNIALLCKLCLCTLGKNGSICNRGCLVLFLGIGAATCRVSVAQHFQHLLGASREEEVRRHGVLKSTNGQKRGATDWLTIPMSDSTAFQAKFLFHLQLF